MIRDPSRTQDLSLDRDICSSYIFVAGKSKRTAIEIVFCFDSTNFLLIRNCKGVMTNLMSNVWKWNNDDVKFDKDDDRVGDFALLSGCHLDLVYHSLGSHFCTRSADTGLH